MRSDVKSLAVTRRASPARCWLKSRAKRPIRARSCSRVSKCSIHRTLLTARADRGAARAVSLRRQPRLAQREDARPNTSQLVMAGRRVSEWFVIIACRERVGRRKSGRGCCRSSDRARASGSRRHPGRDRQQRDRSPAAEPDRGPGHVRHRGSASRSARVADAGDRCRGVSRRTHDLGRRADEGNRSGSLRQREPVDVFLGARRGSQDTARGVGDRAGAANLARRARGVSGAVAATVRCSGRDRLAIERPIG